MLSVSVQIEGERRPGRTVPQVLDGMAEGIAAAWLDVVQDRVRTRGDLAGQHAPPPSQSPLSVPPVYADGVGARWRSAPRRARRREVTESGLERHDSRAEWQARAGVVRGSYDVSGGMWGGARVTPRGLRDAWISFEGQSVGQVADVVEGVAVPRMVSNSEKAATVLEAHGVNILALSEAELAGMARGVALALAQGVATQLPVTWTTPLPAEAMGAIAEIFRQSMR